MFAGVVAALRGEDPPELDHYAPARISHPEHSSATYRFCTNFAVTGTGLSAGRFIEPLEELGDSVLVVGDEATLKVHLHTDDPERATAIFDGIGEVSRLDVADMRAQVAERDGRLSEQADAGGADADAAAASDRRAGALRPSAAARSRSSTATACARCSASSACTPLDGGPTLNPSTYDLLAAIHEVPAEEVVRAAQQRERDHGGRARRASCRTSRSWWRRRPASRRASRRRSRWRPSARSRRTLRRVYARRSRACAPARSRPAARDDAQGRFTRGRGGRLRAATRCVAWGEPDETLRAVLAELARGTATGRRS